MGPEDKTETHFVEKSMVDDFLIGAEQRLGRKGHIEDKEKLMLDWSDYVVVDFTPAEVDLE